MKTLIENGFELWQDIATHLNNRVRETGNLTIDDKSIWDPYLHTWSNTDWILILNALEVLEHHHPEYFDAGHRAIFPEIKQIILTHNRTHFRVMDKREIGLDFKSKAWRGIMSMREVWNNVFKIDLPIVKRARTFRRTNIWTQ